MSVESRQMQDWLWHLTELRKHLLRVLAAFFVVFLMLVYWQSEIYTFFAQPALALLPQGVSMIATDVVSPFLAPMKLVAGLTFVAVLPYALYQFWLFVSPGLYQLERKVVCWTLCVGYFLFWLGMLFAYFLVIPVVLEFMVSVSPQGVVMMPDISHYLSFLLSTFLVFGFAFELPVCQVLCAYFDWLSFARQRSFRPYVVVVIFIAAAVFTPPDVVSQFLLAIPLCFLYELGLWASRLICKKGNNRNIS